MTKYWRSRGSTDLRMHAGANTHTLSCNRLIQCKLIGEYNYICVFNILPYYIGILGIWIEST